MAYTVPHTWVAGDFLRASWLNLTTTDLVDHEARIVALEATGTGNVTGQASSIDSEIALFSSTTGKVIKRATGTGYVKAISGVYQTPVATVPTSDLSGTVALATQVSGNLPLANLPTNFAQIFKATVTLTDAQVKALPTTPITLVSALASKVNVPIAIMLSLNSSAAAYTNIDADSFLIVAFNGSEANGLISAYLPNDTGLSLGELTGFLGAAASKAVFLQVPYAYAYGVFGFATTPRLSADVVNQPLQLTASNSGSGNFTGGNAANSLRADVLYAQL